LLADEPLHPLQRTPVILVEDQRPAEETCREPLIALRKGDFS
jgi:hypothetical protein